MGCCIGRRSRRSREDRTAANVDKLLHDEVANIINDKLLPSYEELVNAIRRTIWRADDAVKELKQITSEIERYHDSVNTAQGVGALAGVAGAVGIVLSPFAGGASLAVAGSVVAVAGTATNVGWALVGETVSNKLLDDASAALKKYESEEEKLQSLYQQFESKCKAVYWQCPRIIQSYFQISDFICVICQVCSRGIEVAKSFASTNAETIAAIATELKAQLAAAEGVSYSANAAVLLGAFAFVTAAVFIFNIYTLKKLLGDSSSEAARKVREATEQLENRKEQLEKLLEKLEHL